jgi:hypothetical protein
LIAGGDTDKVLKPDLNLKSKQYELAVKYKEMNSEN